MRKYVFLFLSILLTFLVFFSPFIYVRQVSAWHVLPKKKSDEVSMSNLQVFNTSGKWHDWFAPGDEKPLVGDFNGDFYDDIITFTSDASGDVWVALNNGGSGFNTASKWHDWFAPNDEIPLVGDFNGDYYKDIVTFTSDASGDVWVALNNGGGGFNTASKWHDYFAPNDEIPLVGDFNGDGYDDIVTFTRGSTGDVYVALSNGSSFGNGNKWHDYFCIGDEIPLVGNFDGNWATGGDDIATFTRGISGDVYVATSNGTNAFVGTGSKWHDYFCIGNEVPAVGYYGFGDIYVSDIVTFTNDSLADVYVAISNGSSFGNGNKWHDYFAPSGEEPMVGDFNYDNYMDIVTFTKGSSADVWIALNPT